ncbi:MAG TPA: DUF6249 domain-containing protein [Casimicrobiaceae bacterium]|nr:DUF6249 domain-containing protein [Casimicrobiaceae bacterium]
MLALSLAAGLVAAFAWGDVRRMPGIPPVSEAVAQTNTPSTPATSEQPPSPKAKPGIDAEISIDERGVTIRNRKGSDEGQMVFGDREFDSFDAFVEQAPALAALVFAVTALVFLVPVAIVGLIIWYKMRSNRLRNETMLKLAERGAVAPDVAMGAIAAPAAVAAPGPLPPAPLYERALALRTRAAWSDLRKGVIMLGIGFGLSLWSILDDQTANAVGLVLLFVGAGYVALWYFEDRQPRHRPSAEGERREVH